MSLKEIQQEKLAMAIRLSDLAKALKVKTEKGEVTYQEAFDQLRGACDDEVMVMVIVTAVSAPFLQ